MVDAGVTNGGEENSFWRGHFARELFVWIESLVWAVIATLLFFALVARVATVSGISMNPTLQDGDLLLVGSTWYTPHCGDIVVIAHPHNPDMFLVKRVIALEGQTVDIDETTGQVLVDGQPLAEPYVKEPINRQMDLPMPQTVPEGHIFVMGDNRNSSVDSRSSMIGMIDVHNVVGKVWLRLFPLNAFGTVG